MARPWSTAGSIIKRNGAQLAFRQKMTQGGECRVSVHLTARETDIVDLAALNWRTTRGKVVRRLLTLALEAKLNEDWR